MAASKSKSISNIDDKKFTYTVICGEKIYHEFIGIRP
jgi:hypothetical protein